MKKRAIIGAGVLALAIVLTGARSGAQLQPAGWRTSQYLESIRENPMLLMDFLYRMPKGGDLHHHLTGAVYAESYIQYAVEDGLCIDQQSEIFPPPCDASKGQLPAADALTNFPFRNQVIDAWSIRYYVPTVNDPSVRLHFFTAFAKFNPVVNRHWGEMFAEVTERAGLEHEIYLETMLTPDQGEAAELGRRVGWSDDLPALRQKMLAAGMDKVVADARHNLDVGEKGMRQILGCGTPQAEAGCGVTLRFINQVLRAFPKDQVYAQMIAGFELASQDPRVVGINLVESQDEYRALHDFDLHMKMLDYLHGVYPKVHISLHAGELTPGEVMPEEFLASHIRKSIDIGHAERIGHGIDVLYEQDAPGLLAQMARQHILVECAIHGYQVVRQIPNNENPYAIYSRAGVPLSLATDDEGVARTDLTDAFRTAVVDFHVRYPELKTLVRNSLDYAFVPGASLWTSRDQKAMVTPCAGQALHAVPDSSACRDFLAASEKASLEWKEEVAFSEFEESIASGRK
ncbi:MAG TPA: adenosine deaminase [Verrucomicrobiae bacterium]|nr:adenosine deaminase [Verrucomicrobiae bacterium]